MIDLIGFAALGMALVAMTSRRIVTLRSLHLTACVLYAVYGILTQAPPVAIGAILFGGIHIYHLSLLRGRPEDTDS